MIKEGLQAYLGDNVQAWEMGADGAYARKTPGKARRSVQEDLLDWLAPPREP